MGFYAPAQIVRDAREHDVEVRPPDVNFSEWDNLLEPSGPAWALRLGLRQVGGLGRTAAERLMAARDVPFTDLVNLTARTSLETRAIRALAAADAFRSMDLDRRAALWEAQALKDAPDLPLFKIEHDEGAEPATILPSMPLCEHVVADYQTLRHVLLYDSPYHGDYPMCGDLWMSEDGLRIFTKCGNVFRATSSRTDDITYNGALQNLGSIMHLSHSSAIGKVIAIPANTFSVLDSDTEIRTFAYDFLTFEQSVPLPRFIIGSRNYVGHGRFVFYNSDASKTFVVLQADSTSGAIYDYGVVTY